MVPRRWTSDGVCILESRLDEVFPPRAHTLRDGRSVQIRAARSTDEEEILQAIRRMCDEARYNRFMRAMREPNLDRLRQVLRSFPEQGLGILATVPAPDGIDVVGDALYLVAPDGQHCEFAVSVAAAFGRAGLATLLMTLLIEAARARGLASMEGYVLARNQGMLKLASRLGFTVARDPDDPSLRVCQLQLNHA